MNNINTGAMAAMAAALASNSQLSSDKVEMRLYLDRLRTMVPQCPKNRKISRQELIEHVIDYISDLQDTLQSDSDSDSDSRPGSPISDFSYGDSCSQHAQYSGYYQQTHLGTSLKDHQSQYGGYGTMHTQQYSHYAQEEPMAMEDSHRTSSYDSMAIQDTYRTSSYDSYYGSRTSNYSFEHSNQNLEANSYGFGF